jgi:hypothetical protein
LYHFFVSFVLSSFVSYIVSFFCFVRVVIFSFVLCSLLLDQGGVRGRERGGEGEAALLLGSGLGKTKFLQACIVLFEGAKDVAVNTV